MNNILNKKIAVCMACASEETNTEHLVILHSVAKKYGCKLVIFSTSAPLNPNDSTYRGNCSIYENIKLDQFDAVICFAASVYDETSLGFIAEAAKKAGIPVFAFDKHMDDCINISMDYKSSFEQIVRHVIEDHGCRVVDYVSGMPNNDFSKEREDIFKKVLADNGIEFEEKRFGHGWFWEQPTRDVVEKFLNDGIPQAIICANDVMALETCKIIKKHGLRVPKDIIVTGFDGIRRAKWSNPDISTCGVDFNLVANKIFEVINSYFGNGQMEAEYLVPFELQLGGSCGCVVGKNEITPDMLFEQYDFNRDYELYQKHMYHMQTALSSKENVMQLASVIHSYMVSDGFVVVDNSLEEFYVGNKLGLKNTEKALPDQMRVLVRKLNNEIEVGTLFNRGEVLPCIDEVVDVDRPLLILPIHSAGNSLGYLAYTMLDNKLFFYQAVAFTYAVGHALEIFRNQKSLKQVNHKLEDTNVQMAELYIRDPLTKMFNRRGFYNSVGELLQNCIDHDWEIFVGSIDLDNLKVINDNYGHSEGDSALKTFSNAMMINVQHNEICARFGGDEFVVAGIAGDAKHCGEKYIKNVEEFLDNYNKDSNKPYEVRASIGLVTGKPVQGSEIDEFILNADRAMYKNKKQKKLFRSRIRTMETPQGELVPAKK